jgi:hypothetical protein
MIGVAQRVLTRFVIVAAPLNYNFRDCFEVGVELLVGVVVAEEGGLLKGVVGGECSGTLCRALSCACLSTTVSLSFCSFVFCALVNCPFTM